MKTKEELKALKQECEELNYKLKALSDDELKFVVGGSHGGISDFMSETEGDWFQLFGDSVYIYRLKNSYMPIKSPDGSITSPAALLERFWHNGSEAWYYGTVSEIACNPDHPAYQKIPAPTVIHDKDMYLTKPY